MPFAKRIFSLLALCLCLAARTRALSWRIFSTTADCVTTSVPLEQWQAVRAQGSSQPEDVLVTIDYAFLASTTKSGRPIPAIVDVWVVDPDGRKLRSYYAQSEGEASFTASASGQGPWQLCFKQRADDGRWRPSAQIQLSYFSVDVASLMAAATQPPQVAASADATEHSPQVKQYLEVAPKSEHFDELYFSLKHLDMQLRAVGAEQRHMQYRTEWHLAMLQGTHSSMLFWSGIQVIGFLVAAGLQVAFIHNMFHQKRGMPAYRV